MTLVTTVRSDARRALPPRGPGGAGEAVRLERLPSLDGCDPVSVAHALRDLPGLALLESARSGRTARWTYLAADPVAVLEAAEDGPDPFAGARRLLGRLDPAAPRDPAASSRPGGSAPPFAGGLVGFVGYDVGRRLERWPARAPDDQGLPELRLALHDWVLAWERAGGRAWLAGRALDGDRARLDERLARVHERLAGLGRPARAGARPGGGTGERLAAGGQAARLAFHSNLDPGEYADRVEAVRAAIARGEIYQANLARRLEAAFDADPWPLYRRLRDGDPAAFAAYLDLGPGRALVSASPEPFLAAEAGGRVRADPIKGTRPRGPDRAADRRLAAELLASAKDRAENTMIVDVLRNDLGRVCRPGTVRVPRLCRLERAGAVQHLVSTVAGRLRPGLDAFDLLAAAFPGGSITGAPKLRAIELIEALEPVRRGPYTGAAGWFGPDGAAATSILIRTFVADGRRLTLHVGGGITWRSEPRAEWAETEAKAAGPLRAIGGAEVGRAPDAGPHDRGGSR